MKLLFLVSLCASFVAVSFGEATTVTTSELSIGKGRVNDDGQTIVNVVETVSGIPTTYHFSVVDGATVYVNEAVGRDEFGNYVEEDMIDPLTFEDYLQKIMEAAEGLEENESASHQPEPSLSFSQSIKQVVHSSSII